MKKTLNSGLFLIPLAFTLVSGSSSAYALIDLNAGVDYNASVQTSDETMMSASVLMSGELINVNRAQIETSQESQVSVEPKAVSTSADLKAYASTAMNADSQIDEMNFTSNRVEVSYKQKGRFLALVPITFNVKAVAHADGTVEVKYPWYAILTVDNKDEVETELKVRVDNALHAKLVGSVKAEGEALNPVFTANESAEVAAQMQAVLQAALEAQGGTETGDN